LRVWTAKELVAKFPKLLPGTYRRASNASARYNCVAFANGDDRHWWEPGCYGGRHYWPPNIKQQDTVDAWVELFVQNGFEQTNSREHERGFEKVAIYVDLTDMLPSHVAKSDGLIWKSKLGKDQDIEHASLEILEGDQGHEYGIVQVVLKKKLEAKRARKKTTRVQG
jgi:hypothetical protein